MTKKGVVDWSVSLNILPAALREAQSAGI